MQVVDGLTAVGAGVENDAIAVIEPAGARNLGGLGKQMARQQIAQLRARGKWDRGGLPHEA